MLLRLRLSPHALKRFTDKADATDFIFSRISFNLIFHLILDLFRIIIAPARRWIVSSKRQSVILIAPGRRRQIQQDTIKIREKNRSVASGLSVIDFEYGERAQ